MIKIAICEDEASARAYLATLVRAQSWPCEIVEYACAGDCLADTQEVDLLFLDIELAPGGPDGMALARKIRERSSGMRPVIIFVTGYICPSSFSRRWRCCGRNRPSTMWNISRLGPSGRVSRRRSSFTPASAS